MVVELSVSRLHSFHGWFPLPHSIPTFVVVVVSFPLNDYGTVRMP